jgi:hypothetical protein
MLLHDLIKKIAPQKHDRFPKVGASSNLMDWIHTSRRMNRYIVCLVTKEGLVG